MQFVCVCAVFFTRHFILLQQYQQNSVIVCIYTKLGVAEGIEPLFM